MSSSPTLIQQITYNNGFRWDNPTSSLLNVKTTNIFAYTTLKIKQLAFRPSVDVMKISSHIYYDTLSFVQQAKKDIEIYKVGVEFDFKKGKFSTSNQIYVTTKSDENNLIRLPPFFFNSRVGYDLLYKKKLYIQAGVELHYKSAYFANAYMPAIQQFHLQNTQPVEGYLQADVFADMRINRVRLFLKFTNVNQYISNGYYATPGFAAMGKTFNFGVHWLLFD
jgi:hypothetical protein